MRAEIVFPALLAAVVSMSELSADSVQWLGRRTGMIAPGTKARIDLSVLSLQEIGTRDRSYGLTNAADYLLETLSGIQRLVLQIKCELLDSLDLGSTYTYLDRIRRRLHTEYQRNTLRAAGVSVLSAEPITPIQGQLADNRVKEVSVYDQAFGVSYNETDSHPISWIETIGWVGEFSS